MAYKKGKAKNNYFVAVSVLAVSLFSIAFLTYILTKPLNDKQVAATTGANVSIVDFQFQPSTLSVPVGTTVTWTNMSASGAMHTTTSDTQGTANSWDSGLTQKGTTFSHTFNAAGTFTYHCNVHTFMRGTITVTAAAPQPTAVPPAPTTVPAAPTIAPPTTTVPSPACLGTTCIPTVGAPSQAPQPITSTAPIPTLAVNPPAQGGGNQNLLTLLITFITLILQFLQHLL